MDFLGAYFKSASVSVVSKFVAILANIAILWLSAHILGKEDFGVFMVALAAITLFGLMIPGPFCSVVLYHASRLKDAPDEAEIGKSMTGRALFWALLLSFIISAGFVVLAPSVENLFNMEGMAFWLITLAPMLVFETARRVLAVWHRAQQRVEIFIIYNEIWPNVLKTVFLLIALLFSANMEGIALAMNLSLFIPLLAILKKEPVWPNIKGKVFTEWDIKYGAKNLFTYGLNQQSRGFDLILVGALSSAIVAADYAIASRLGRFLLIGKQGLSQLLAPRMGALMGTQDINVAALEFTVMRFIGFAIAVCGAFGVLLLGEWIVGLFCATCTNAYPILLILSAAFIINTAFGSPEDYMTMAGHAGWNLTISIVSTSVMVVLCAVLIPSLGGEGAALAVLLAFLIRGIGMMLAITRLDKVALVTPRQILISVFIALSLIAVAYDELGKGACFFLILVFVFVSVPKKRAGGVARFDL